MSKSITGIAKIRFELVELVIASTNDKQTESKLLGLIEELADESEKRGYHDGWWDSEDYYDE
jgi:hypothetical protein